MNGLFVAAAEVCGFMQARDWEFCIIGGLAVQRWGEPRTTLDVDITLLTGWGEEEVFVDPLFEQFEARVPDARDIANQYRVLLIRASNGSPVDISLGAVPFEEEVVRRATVEELAAGLTVPCCTPEDLVIMKAFAGRDQDWFDIKSVIRRQSSLDAGRIVGRLEQLVDPDVQPDTVSRVRRLLENPV